MKILKYNGEELSPRECAEKYGVSIDVIRTRLSERNTGKKEYTDEQIIFGKKLNKVKLLTAYEITRPLNYWVETFNLSKNSVRQRLSERDTGKESYTDEEVLFGKKSSEHLILYKGEIKPVEYWAKLYHLDEDRIKERVMSEKPLTAKETLFNKADPLLPFEEEMFTHKGVTRSIKEWITQYKDTLNELDVIKRYHDYKNGGLKGEEVLFGFDPSNVSDIAVKLSEKLREEIDKTCRNFSHEHLFPLVNKLATINEVNKKTSNNITDKGVAGNKYLIISVGVCLEDLILSGLSIPDLVDYLEKDDYLTIEAKKEAISPFIPMIDLSTSKLVKGEIMQLLSPVV